ncbi:hypothetical protein MKM42_02345 [Streptococcus suis]|nr:hypothetical protein [Streptococcus suis]
MKLSEFADILEQADLPVTYRAYQEGNVPDMPYLVYFESNPIVNSADNTRHHEIKSVVVELAFERKDEDLEERLEELWSNQELFFEAQEETFIETERLYVKPYTVYLY